MATKKKVKPKTRKPKVASQEELGDLRVYINKNFMSANGVLEEMNRLQVALNRRIAEVNQKVGEQVQAVVANAAKEAMYDAHFRDRISQLAVRETVHLVRPKLEPVLNAEVTKAVCDELRRIDMGPILEKMIGTMVAKIVANMDFVGRSMQQTVQERIGAAAQAAAREMIIR